jgi:hypothetical protein
MPACYLLGVELRASSIHCPSTDTRRELVGCRAFASTNEPPAKASGCRDDAAPTHLHHEIARACIARHPYREAGGLHRHARLDIRRRAAPA